MQMTIRNIPANVRKALEKAAARKDVSLNQMALDALAAGLGVSKGNYKRDLSDTAGTMTPEDAKALEEYLAASDAASVLGQLEDERQGNRYATGARHQPLRPSHHRSA